jgi:hypothetical protein
MQFSLTNASANVDAQTKILNITVSGIILPVSRVTVTLNISSVIFFQDVDVCM